MDSIKHDKWGGLLVFSGLQGLGKSEAAFTAEAPDLLGILDFDLKGETMAKEYGIKNFWQPEGFMKPDMDPTEYDAEQIHTWTIDKLVNLPTGLTTLVIDNATAMEAGLEYLVEKNPAKYGLNPQNVAAGRYGGANPGISILWQNITMYLKNQKGISLIIMVNHMTQPWADGKPVPNRFHVKGNKIFRQLSAGTFIFTPADPKRGGIPPIPSALVVKESLANRRFDPEAHKHITQRTIPHRFPVARWAEMTAYFDNPADFANPKPGETWSPFEISAYGEFLSPETLEWMKATAGMSLTEGEDGGKKAADALAAGRARLLKELKPHYKDLNEIADAVKKLTPPIGYSLQNHEVIKAKLLAAKGIEQPKEFVP